MTLKNAGLAASIWKLIFLLHLECLGDGGKVSGVESSACLGSHLSSGGLLHLCDVAPLAYFTNSIGCKGTSMSTSRIELLSFLGPFMTWRRLCRPSLLQLAWAMQRSLQACRTHHFYSGQLQHCDRGLKIPVTSLEKRLPLDWVRRSSLQ